jgi:hypothetical protein
LKVALGDRACGFAEQILKLQCPVSVHLRLGDYAQILRSTGPAGRQVTNVLSSQYYDRAILDLQKRHENVTLIVFSDEPSAARALMQEKGPCVFIEGNGTQRAHEDMWLMSLCKHHVLANSSFSWWGGWLCQTESKRMYAPRYWTNCEQSYYPDLYPVGCEVIDNLNSE